MLAFIRAFSSFSEGGLLPSNRLCLHATPIYNSFFVSVADRGCMRNRVVEGSDPSTFQLWNVLEKKDLVSNILQSCCSMVL
jgi:hypothetical protein